MILSNAMAKLSGFFFQIVVALEYLKFNMHQHKHNLSSLSLSINILNCFLYAVSNISFIYKGIKSIQNL